MSMKSAGKDFGPTKLWSEYDVKYAPIRINKSAKQCITNVRKGDKYEKSQESNKDVCHYKNSTSAYTGLVISCLIPPKQ